MLPQFHSIFKKLAALSYSMGVVSLIVGIILSLSVHPVAASNNATGGGTHKIWICHVSASGNKVPVYVDEDGWSGHDDHPRDFRISGPNDRDCSNPTSIPPTKVPTTAVPPTEVPPTQVPPTEVPPTQVPPTEVPPTEVPPTEVPPTEVPPTEVPPTEEPEITVTLQVTPQDTVEPTATGTLEPTGTPEETAEPTATLAFTATETVTEASTLTPTLTPTGEIELVNLKLSWACVNGVQVWTVTNESGSSVQFSWELDNAGTAMTNPMKLASPKKIQNLAIDSGSATVPANSQYSWSTLAGYHTMVIRWDNGDGSDSSRSVTTSETVPCQVPETSSSPTPQNGTTPVSGVTPQTQNTRVNRVVTLTPDPGDPALTEEILIPVTGDELPGLPFADMPLSGIFINLGMVLLGVALTSHGIFLKFK